ncbi:hypothetical protein WJX74_001090 [Apatococcus lobatus]|uniref:DNA ligase n=1 Tax=Apatococcus lobatus TaxID=904363 RepID=A0AAW1RYK4_9CHLO
MGVRPPQLSFETLARFFAHVKALKPKLRQKALTRLIQDNIENESAFLFDFYRLLLPQLDNERRNYGLQETTFVKVLNKACLKDPNVHPSAKRAIDFKKHGDFADIMKKELFSSGCGKLPDDASRFDLKLHDVNERLDQLVKDDSKQAKAQTLQWLLQHTTPDQMMWICRIILHDLKIGMRESVVLPMIHEDAPDLLNVTSSLRTVCHELRDRSKRYPRKDVEPLKNVRPQLAKSGVASVEQAFQLMRGKPFLVETKFDGERIQVHRKGSQMAFFSRNALEHGMKSSYDILMPVFEKQMKPGDFILDGELIVWNRSKRAFEPFGGLKSTVIGARDGAPPSKEIVISSGVYGRADDEDEEDSSNAETAYLADLHLAYIAFDILYIQSESVINRTLLQRQEVLKSVVEPMEGDGTPVGQGTVNASVQLLLPGQGLRLPNFLLPGEAHGDRATCSERCTTLEQIETMFRASTDLKEEGIIIKAADSPWVTNDRSAAWVKLKPDYVKQSELDAVIIGGLYGKRQRRAGRITEFLLALAEEPLDRSQAPTRFISFCRVGTGLSDAERDKVEKRLRPLMIEAKVNKSGKSNAPSCYKVTHKPKERPDVWISDPLQSIVVEVKADVRMIKSEQFATDWSLRFPRIQRLREDKSASEVQTHEDFKAMVQQNRGTMTGSGHPAKGSKSAEKKKQNPPARIQPAEQGVVDHFRPVDISGIQVEGDTLKQCVVWFINSGSMSAAERETLVARLGGKVSQNWTPLVTHSIAAEKSGFKFQAHLKQQRDVISMRWLQECQDQHMLSPLRPHHYLFLSEGTKQKMPDIDQFGDSYFDSCEAQDLRAIMEGMRIADLDSASLQQLTLDDPAEDSRPPDPPSTKRRIKKKSTGIQLAPMHEIITTVDKLLNQQALQDLSSCVFRGMRCCLVSITAPALDAAQGQCQTDTWNVVAAARQAEQALIPIVLSRIALQVLLGGGKTSPVVTRDTTHLVALLDKGGQCSPQQLLEAVVQQAGGSAAATVLGHALHAQTLQLVTARWVEECEAAASAAEPGDSASVITAQPAMSLLKVVDGAPNTLPDKSLSPRPNLQLATWPWSAVGASPPGNQAAEAAHSGSCSESDASDGGKTKRNSAGRGRGRSKGVRKACKPPSRPKAAAGTRGRGRRGKGTKILRTTASNSHPDVPSPAGSNPADTSGDDPSSPVSTGDHGSPFHAQGSLQASKAKPSKTPSSKRKRRALLPELCADGTLQKDVNEGAEPQNVSPLEVDDSDGGPAARTKRRRQVRSESNDADDAAAGTAFGHDSDATASSGDADRGEMPLKKQQRALLPELAADETLQRDVDMNLGPAARAKLRHQDSSVKPTNPDGSSAGHAEGGDTTGSDSNATATSGDPDRQQQQQQPVLDRRASSKDATGSHAIEGKAAFLAAVVGGDDEPHADEEEDDDDDPFAAMMREVTGARPSQRMSAAAVPTPLQGDVMKSPEVQQSKRLLHNGSSDTATPGLPAAVAATDPDAASCPGEDDLIEGYVGRAAHLGYSQMLSSSQHIFASRQPILLEDMFLSDNWTAGAALQTQSHEVLSVQLIAQGCAAG